MLSRALCRSQNAKSFYVGTGRSFSMSDAESRGEPCIAHPMQDVAGNKGVSAAASPVRSAKYVRELLDVVWAASSRSIKDERSTRRRKLCARGGVSIG